MGKDAQGNWDLIVESEPDEVWIHLASFPSPHVVISPDPTTEQLIEAGNLCRSNSKFKNLKNIKIVYTRIDNLVLVQDQIGCVDFKSKRQCSYMKI